MVGPSQGRRLGSRVLLIVTIGLSVFCISGSASAFCRSKTCGEKCTRDEDTCPVEGIPLAWVGSCVSYSVQRDGSSSISRAELSQATDAAFRAWQEAQCPSTGAPPSMAVVDVFGPAICGRVEYNSRQANANIIVIRESWEEASSNVLALTTTSFSKITGEIYDADIEVNGSHPISAGPLQPNFFDLQSILTHEAGHFFGIAHSNKGLPDCRAGATMCPRYVRGTGDFQTLEEDDVAAMCTVYPPERKAPACNPSPHLGFSPECGLDPMSGGCSLAISAGRWSARGMTAIALALGVAIARRRRTEQRTQKLA